MIFFLLLNDFHFATCSRVASLQVLLSGSLVFSFGFTNPWKDIWFIAITDPSWPILIFPDLKPSNQLLSKDFISFIRKSFWSLNLCTRDMRESWWLVKVLLFWATLVVIELGSKVFKMLNSHWFLQSNLTHRFVVFYSSWVGVSSAHTSYHTEKEELKFQYSKHLIMLFYLKTSKPSSVYLLKWFYTFHNPEPHISSLSLKD